MPATINFSSDQFKSLMYLFSYIKESCPDLTIKEGKIHQLSSTKTLLFDIDLSKFFNNSTIYINNLKQQHSLLNLFALDNSEVKLIFDKNKYIWMDKKGKIEYLIPDEDNLNPKYLDTENKRAKELKDTGNKIFETSLDRTVLRRIAQSSKTLESKIINLNVSNDSAQFTIIPGDLIASTKFQVHEVDELIDESHNCSTQYDLNSFLLPTEELKLTLYNNSTYSSVFTMVYDAHIETIPVKIWSGSKYVSNT